jgi:hypothetical protein
MRAPVKPRGGYIRVSRKGDRENLRSPDMQRDAIKRFADANEIIVDFAEPEIDVSRVEASRAVLDALARPALGSPWGAPAAPWSPLVPPLRGADRVIDWNTVLASG